MRVISSIFFLLLTLQPLHAVKAYPYPIRVQQPDGSTLEILLHGDEYFRYVTTTDGRLVAKGADGFFRYAIFENGVIRPSGAVATSSPVSLSSILGTDKTEPIPKEEISLMRTKGISRMNAAGGMAPIDLNTMGTVNVLVIPVEFSDISFSISSPTNHFYRMLNQYGYSEYGGTGSAKEYFEANISGKTFNFDVTEVVRLSKSYSHYGANDESTPSVITYDANIKEMVSEACSLANSQTDFSKYDNDKDGKVDYVFIYFAGGNEAESGDPNAIWPQTYNITNEGLRLDGVQIGMFGCSSELMGSSSASDDPVIPAGIGTFCHEFSHSLGLKDLYDVNYASGGRSKCLWGKLSVMDEGNYNNSSRTPPYYCAIDRELAGVLDYIEPTIGSNTLYPIDQEGKAIKIGCEKSGEYYLIENRLDRSWDEYIGGSGLVIYHIDKSSNIVDGITASVRWSNNLINTYSEHECADLVEAYHAAEHISQVFFPGQASVTEFSPSTNPAFIDWAGTPVGYKLSDISQNGETVTFTMSEDNTEVLLVPEKLNAEAYQRTAFLEWECDRPGLYQWGVEWGLYSDYPQTAYKDTVRLTGYTIKDLEPFTDYFCRVYHIGQSAHGDSVSVRFTTLALTSPYPYMNIPRKNLYRGDRIDLTIENLNEETVSIRWFVNETEIYVTKAVFNYAGTYELKAIIKYASDNSEEVITRTITIHENPEGQ